MDVQMSEIYINTSTGPKQERKASLHLTVFGVDDNHGIPGAYIKIQFSTHNRQ